MGRINRQIDSGCRNVIGHTTLAATILIHLLVCAEAVGQRELRVLHCQRLLRKPGKLCYFLFGAVGILCRHPQPCGIERLSCLIVRFFRRLLHSKRGDNAADTHQVAGVVLEIQIPVLICNRAANGVLCLRTCGGEQGVSRL